MQNEALKAGAIPAGAVLLSAQGGSIDMLLDGEIVASIAIPAGRVPIAGYMDLLPEGAWYEPVGLAVLVPRSLVASQSWGDLAAASGANPDFRPTTASRFEMEMRLMVSSMQERERAVDAKIRALQSIERIPRAPAPEVIEPAPAPAADPAPGV